MQAPAALPLAALARIGALALLAAVAGVGPAVAQTGQPPLSMGIGPPVLTIDQERMFADSAFGQRVAETVQEASLALAAENRALEAELMAEELALTERRASLTPEEFRELADSFDARVETIRRTQERRGEAIVALRDSERQRFFEAALPILAQLVAESGAVAVLDLRMVLLAIDEADVTDRAIARIDARIGDGGPPPDGDLEMPPLAVPPSRPMPRPPVDGGPPLELPRPPEE